MALPSGWTQIQVFCTYNMLDGTPASGNVSFVSDQIVVVNNTVIVPKIITAGLNANGYFSVLLPATNDPDIIPSGWKYTVVENLDWGGATRRKQYPLTVSANGSSIDLSAYAPIPPFDSVSSLSLYNLSIGTVTTGQSNTASANITGNAPNQSLNLTLPVGPVGPVGNVLFATFALDSNSGDLIITTPDGYTGPVFNINTQGILEVNIV